MNADEAISTLLKLKEDGQIIEIAFVPDGDCSGVPSEYMNAPGIFVRVMNPAIHPGGFSAEVSWPQKAQTTIYVPYAQCFNIKQMDSNRRFVDSASQNNTYGKVKLPLGWAVYEGGRAKANG